MKQTTNQRNQNNKKSLKSPHLPKPISALSTNSTHSTHSTNSTHSNHSTNSTNSTHSTNLNKQQKSIKKTNARTLPHYLRYYMWCEFDRDLIQKQNFAELRRQSGRRSLTKLIKKIQNWKIDRRYVIYQNNVATKIKFGLIRWYVERKCKINVETCQPKHKHLDATPQQMLIGFVLSSTPNQNESVDQSDGKLFHFLKENDWVDMSKDLIFFKRIDYSFLLKVVVVDERSKRRKRFLTSHSFRSPFQTILNSKPPICPEQTNDKNPSEISLEEWPSKEELYEMKLIIMQSELLSPHQFIHPSEKILSISNDQVSSNGLSFEKTNTLFSFDWFNKLPISFEDDWALLRDTCDNHLQEIREDEERVITEEATGDVVDQESNLLPDTLDSYAMYAFKSRPHGLLRREWKPLSTKQAIELIKSTLPEKTSLVSAGEQNNYRPPNNYFYEGGRLYKILTARSG